MIKKHKLHRAQALQTLIEHNLWRRGSLTLKQTDPFTLGLAIECAIDALKPKRKRTVNALHQKK